MIESLAMLGAIEKKARVRRDIERGFAQAIIIQIHDILLANKVPEERKRFVRRSGYGGGNVQLSKRMTVTASNPSFYLEGLKLDVLFHQLCRPYRLLAGRGSFLSRR